MAAISIVKEMLLMIPNHFDEYIITAKYPVMVKMLIQIPVHATIIFIQLCVSLRIKVIACIGLL